MNKPNELEYRLLSYLGSCPIGKTPLGKSGSLLYSKLFDKFLFRNSTQPEIFSREILKEIGK